MDLYFLILLRILLLIMNKVFKERNPLKSDLCGEYCLYYAFAKCKGLSMDEIIYNIPNYKDVVNFVNRLFLYLSEI